MQGVGAQTFQGMGRRASTTSSFYGEGHQQDAWRVSQANQHVSTPKETSLQTWVGGNNYDGEFNKPLNIFKVSILLEEDFTKEARSSRV